jgi:hypothetical protein
MSPEAVFTLVFGLLALLLAILGLKYHGTIFGHVRRLLKRMLRQRTSTRNTHHACVQLLKPFISINRC